MGKFSSTEESLWDSLRIFDDGSTILDAFEVVANAKHLRDLGFVPIEISGWVIVPKGYYGRELSAFRLDCRGHVCATERIGWFLDGECLVVQRRLEVTSQDVTTWEAKSTLRAFGGSSLELTNYLQEAISVLLRTKAE
jgi:hypothetical protein